MKINILSREVEEMTLQNLKLMPLKNKYFNPLKLSIVFLLFSSTFAHAYNNSSPVKLMIYAIKD